MIVTGNHSQSATGNVALDIAIIDALRAGVLIACRLPDDRLAFTPALPMAPPAEPGSRDPGRS
ncbi:hypothetical protein ACQP2X_39565 [Actinoplanes sp. CA-131856]